MKEVHLNKHTYLFKKSVNELLKLVQAMSCSEIEIPNDIELSKRLNISRNTVRNCVEYIIALGIIERNGVLKSVLRQPEDFDFFELSEDNAPKDEQIEKYFFKLIHSGKLLPGERFSERSLAQASGCSTSTVREFLNKFSINKLIEKAPRGQWRMTNFDESFAKEICQFRRIIELAAISELLKLPEANPVWCQLQELLSAHLELKANFNTRYKEFPELDRRLHKIIQDSSGNRFTSHFFSMVSSICHYQYQWDKKEKFDKYSTALDEHLEILTNLVTHNAASAIISLENHLKTAEKTLYRCVKSLNATQNVQN